ncbi:MAG: hypothetical protein ACFFG0_31555 [Candidatus Thorarchaeota archaeon]
MKKIDLIIIGYGALLILDFIFLTVVQRFDVLLISGPLALIPLIITLVRRMRD